MSTILTKEAGLAQLVKQVYPYLGKVLKPAFNHPWKTGKALVSTTGRAMAAPMVAEYLGKTVNNFAHGKPELGNMSYTGGQVGHGLNWMSELTGIGPLISNTGKNLADLAGDSPRANRVMSIAENIASGKVVDHAREAVTDLIRHPGVASGLNSATRITQALNDPAKLDELLDAGVKKLGPAARSAAAGTAKGMVEGAGQAIMDKPAPTIAAAIFAGAAPLVAYDLATRKKKQEQEQNQNVILNYVKRQQGLATKSAGWAEVGKFLSTKAGPALKSLVHKPTVVRLPFGQSLTDAKGVIDHAAYSKLYDSSLPRYSNNVSNVLSRTRNMFSKGPQPAMKPGGSLLNSEFARNPLKTAFLGTAAVGAGAEGYKVLAYPTGDTNPLDTAWRMTMGAMDGPLKIITSVESAALQNDRNKEIAAHPVVERIKKVVSDLKSGKYTGSEPAKGEPDWYDTIKNSPEAQQLSRIKNNLTGGPAQPIPESAMLPEAKLDPAPLDPTPVQPSPTGWRPKDFLPYAAAASALAIPYAGYAAYDHFHNRKLNKVKARNEQVVSQLTQ